MVLECLEAKLLGDHDGDHIPGETCHPNPLASFQMQQFCLYLHNIQCYVGAM
jgi:hypothetical protein